MPQSVEVQNLLDEGTKLKQQLERGSPSVREKYDLMLSVSIFTRRVDDALPIFEMVFKREPIWATLTPRLVKSGFLPDDPVLIERILAVAPGQR